MKFLADKKGFQIDKNFGTIVDIEKPIFVKDSRRFITDCIVDLVSSQHCLGTTSSGTYHLKSFEGGDLKIIRGAIYRRAILDLKPALLSVSNSIGQIRTYAHFLPYMRWENGVKKGTCYPDMILLTLDTNDDFDGLCESQSIYIYHVNPKEVKR